MQIEQSFEQFHSMTIEQRRELIKTSGSRLKWVEIPVDLKTFVEGKQYLSHPPLSPIQYEAVYESSELFDIDAACNDATHVSFRDAQYIESVLVWGKGCIASSTRLQNAVTGEVRTASEWASKPSSIPLNTLMFTPPSCIRGHYRKASWKSECANTTNGGVFRRGHGPMYRVTTRAGFQIEVYKYHLFMTRPLRQFGSRPGRDQWKELADLGCGDWVAMSAKTAVSQGTRLPEDHVKLLAYWIGDAALSKMQMIASSQEVIDEYCGLAERFTKGLKAKTAHQKRVPIEIFALPDDQLRIFVERLWSTDGYLSATNAPEIGYTSANVDLVRDVQRLLLRFGIVGRIQKKRVRKPAMRDGKIIQKAGEFGTYYSLRIRSIGMCQRFVEEFNVPGKSIDLSGYPEGKGKYHDGAVFWDKIAKIEPIGEGEYYDLTVPDVNTYAAHGFWNHNSGKDTCAMIILSRILYLLGCLTNPHEVFGMPEHSSIDILNMALGENQAMRVFFAPWKRLIAGSDWFMNKLQVKLMSTSIRVPPIIGRDDDLGDMYAVNAWCGNSSQEGAEGRNLLVAVLDEIDGFRDLKYRKGGAKKLQDVGTAQGMYDTMTSSVQSRFPGIGKVVLISWPRYRGSFIERQRAKGEEEPMVFTSGPYAVWDVHPLRTREEFSVEFRRNPEMAEAKYAARPGAVIDRYFTNSLAILECFHATQKDDFSIVRNKDSPGPEPPVDFDNMMLVPGAMSQPDMGALYCVHIDLAVTSDRAALGMSHHVGYTQLDDGEDELVPVIQADMLYWWESQEGQEINFAEIRRFVLLLARAGYRIASVTLDGFQSVDTIQILGQYDQYGRRLVYDYVNDKQVPRSAPIDTGRFSLDTNTAGYDTLKEVIYEPGRLRAFFCPLVVEELLNLILVQGRKVDHLDTGSKDVADALAGSVYGAVNYQNEALRQLRYRSSGPGMLIGGAQAQGPGRESENFAVSDGGRMLIGGAGSKKKRRRGHY